MSKLRLRKRPGERAMHDVNQESNLREQSSKVTRESTPGRHSKEQSRKSGRVIWKSNSGEESRRAFQKSLPKSRRAIQERSPEGPSKRAIWESEPGEQSRNPTEQSGRVVQESNLGEPSKKTICKSSTREPPKRGILESEPTKIRGLLLGRAAHMASF